MTSKKAAPTWSNVKTKLTDFNNAGLLGLVQDLYAASKDNQAFLHVRLGLGDDPLKPYKAIIARWINPDVTRNQDISVAKAKKAITDYRKAIGRPEGLAELGVFYCEQVFALLSYCGIEDQSYYSALVRMFDLAVMSVTALPETQRKPFLDRLERVRAAGHGYGWGVGDEFEFLWLRAGLEIG